MKEPPSIHLRERYKLGKIWLGIEAWPRAIMTSNRGNARFVRFHEESGRFRLTLAEGPKINPEKDAFDHELWGGSFIGSTTEELFKILNRLGATPHDRTFILTRFRELRKDVNLKAAIANSIDNTNP